MTHRPRTTRHLIAPVVLIGMAAMVPLALAGEGASALDGRATAGARAGDRTEALVQLVSEAARQLCGAQAAIVTAEPSGLHANLPCLGVVGVVDAQLGGAPEALRPSLIDLPPPLA